MLKGGLIPKKFLIVGARPGMGKSTLTNQLVFDVLDLNKDKKMMVLYWSFEMQGMDQMDRLASKVTRKETFAYDAKISDESLIEYTKAVSNYRDYPVYFCERPVSSKKIHHANIDIAKKYPEHQVLNIIDHSRYVSKENERDEYAMLNSLSKDIHMISVETSAISILISQLNRDIEKEGRVKTMYKPLQSDLFGSDSVNRAAA